MDKSFHDDEYVVHTKTKAPCTILQKYLDFLEFA